MGKKRQQRPLSRQKKRKFRGNQHQVVDPDVLSSEQLERVQKVGFLVVRPRQNCGKVPPFQASSSSRTSVQESDCSSAELSDCHNSDDESTQESEWSGDDSDCASDESDESFQDVPELTGYRIVDVNILSAQLVAQACSCRHCGGSLCLKEPRRWGVAPELCRLSWNKCKSETIRLISERYGRFIEVNRRSGFAGRAVGLGREGLTRVWGLMGMPKYLSSTSFQSHQEALLLAATEIATQSLNQAAANVVQLQEEDGSTAAMDISVTFDGTWMKRGHTSLHGATTAISWLTGQVVDYEMYSKFSHACSSLRSSVAAGKISEANFTEWRRWASNEASSHLVRGN